MFRNKKAQSTLEYITIFVAIVAAIVAFAWSTLNPAAKSMLEASANKITNAVTAFETADVSQ